MGRILLENMEFFAYHGHFSEEQIVGNKFLINIELLTNMDKPSVSDDLSDALDYQSVYRVIKSEMENKSHLLEHIAGRILKRLFQQFVLLDEATIKVSKMNPPIGGMMKAVSVVMTKTKSDF